MARRWSVLAGWVPVMMALSGFSRSPGVSAQAAQISQYVYVLIVLGIAVVAAILVWWWISVRSRPEEIPPREAQVAAADDLTRIEGIGPQISNLLQETGISTFEELAEANMDLLQVIVADAELTGLADPTTWPEQARLAAAGEWERLEALQDELKAGRRD